MRKVYLTTELRDAAADLLREHADGIRSGEVARQDWTAEEVSALAATVAGMKAWVELADADAALMAELLFDLSTDLRSGAATMDGWDWFEVREAANVLRHG